MRQNHGSKRSRGRNSNRRNGPSRNQTFDSNGPSVRIRGNASQVHEKYLTMARDAGSSGDRVAAENYLQHAEHYYRILAIQREEAEARANSQQTNRNNGNGRRPKNEEVSDTNELEGEDGTLSASEVEDTSEMPAFVTKKSPEPTETVEESDSKTESISGDD